MPHYLTSYAPQKLGDTFRNVRTVEQAIAVDAPKLGAMTRGGLPTLAVIKLNIAAMDKALRCKDGLTPEDIELIAEEVTERWSGLLTMADVSLIIRNAKVGKYGELYEKLTAAKVIGWFESYASEKMQKHYELHRKEDELRYGSTRTKGDDCKVLESMGYRLSEDGRLMRDETGSVVCQKVVEEQKRKREETKTQQDEEVEKTMQEHNDYMRARYLEVDE